MPPQTQNFDNNKTKRNKIALGVVLAVVILIVVSLLSIDTGKSPASPVANQKTREQEMRELVESSSATGPSLLSKKEQQELILSSSAKKSTISEEEREDLVRSSSVQ